MYVCTLTYIYIHTGIQRYTQINSFLSSGFTNVGTNFSISYLGLLLFHTRKELHMVKLSLFVKIIMFKRLYLLEVWVKIF